MNFINTTNYYTETVTASGEEIPQWRKIEDAITHPKDGVPVKTRKYLLKSYKNVFVASEAVDWIIAKGYLANREAAVAAFLL